MFANKVSDEDFEPSLVHFDFTGIEGPIDIRIAQMFSDSTDDVGVSVHYNCSQILVCLDNYIFIMFLHALDELALAGKDVGEGRIRFRKVPDAVLLQQCSEFCQGLFDFFICGFRLPLAWKVQFRVIFIF